MVMERLDQLRAPLDDPLVKVQYLLRIADHRGHERGKACAV